MLQVGIFLDSSVVSVPLLTSGRETFQRAVISWRNGQSMYVAINHADTPTISQAGIEVLRQADASSPSKIQLLIHP